MIAFHLNDEPALFALLAYNPHMLRSLRCIFLACVRSESFNRVYWQASIECIGRYAASYMHWVYTRTWNVHSGCIDGTWRVYEGCIEGARRTYRGRMVGVQWMD